MVAELFRGAGSRTAGDHSAKNANKGTRAAAAPRTPMGARRRSGRARTQGAPGGERSRGRTAQRTGALASAGNAPIATIGRPPSLATSKAGLRGATHAACARAPTGRAVAGGGERGGGGGRREGGRPVSGRGRKAHARGRDPRGRPHRACHGPGRFAQRLSPSSSPRLPPSPPPSLLPASPIGPRLPLSAPAFPCLALSPAPSVRPTGARRAGPPARAPVPGRRRDESWRPIAYRRPSTRSSAVRALHRLGARPERP